MGHPGFTRVGLKTNREPIYVVYEPQNITGSGAGLHQVASCIKIAGVGVERGRAGSFTPSPSGGLVSADGNANFPAEEAKLELKHFS